MQRQKKNKSKPQLFIDASQDSESKNNFKRKVANRNEVQIKPPMSAKNQHQLKNAFNFSEININQHSMQKNKLLTLQRLQMQKQDLMKSLLILKQGAVSAIVQKEQQINQLKQQIYSNASQKQIKIYEKQLELKELYRKDLEDELGELRRELRNQRLRYQSELYQKQEIIHNIEKELDSSYNRLEQMERCDQLMNEKVRIMQYQNSNLLQQLETSQLLNTSNASNFTIPQMNLSMSQGNFNLDETIGFHGQVSVASTIPKKYSQHMLTQQDDHFSSSYFSQRVYVIQQQHRQQIQKLKNHYEQKISRLKNVYQKGNQRTIQKNYSKQSLRSVKDQDQTLIRSRKNSNCKSTRTLSKNNSMEGLRLEDRMYAIDERAQHDQDFTPRYNFTLKDQIIQSKYGDNITMTNTRNPHDDTLSQFTSQHFQYPFAQTKLFQRTSSTATFQGEKYQQKIDKKSIQMKLSKNSSKSNLTVKDDDSDNDDKLSQSSRKSFKKDLMLFCVGLVTGGTLFGVGTKLFK